MTKRALLPKVTIGVILLSMFLVLLVLKQWPDTQAHMIFCDVGQGDAILITSGFTQVLIDAGKDKKVLECLTRFMPWWDKTLEVALATHADGDHIGGFVDVLEGYRIGHFILTNQQKETTEFVSFVKALEKEQKDSGMTFSLPEQGKRLVLGSLVEVIMLYPPLEKAIIMLEAAGIHKTLSEILLSDNESSGNSKQDDFNNGSIVLFVQLGAARVLLTGDLEKPGEVALSKEGLLQKADVLKVGHHGSKSGTTDSFLSQVQPEFAVISAGKNNSYGHPDGAVLSRLEKKGVKIFRTDVIGDIELVSDQAQFWFK